MTGWTRSGCAPRDRRSSTSWCGPASTGHVVRGPFVGGTQAYVLTSDWLGGVDPVPREEALARLARRYLAGHGPADDRDLAKWSGLPLGDARAGLRAIAAELVERPEGGVELRRHRRRTARRPPSQAPGSVRTVAPRLAVAHRGARLAPGRGHRERPLPRHRAGRRRGRRHVAHRALGGGARAVRAAGPVGGARALERDAADVLRYLALRSRPFEIREPPGTRSKTAGRRRP